MKNGGRPQIVIKTKKSKWDKGARERFRSDWNEIHQGPDRAGNVGLLEDGADLQVLEYSNEAAQFLTLKQHRVEDICRWYGVQPHLVAHLLRSTNNNIEQQSVEFVQYTMLPWLIMWEHFLNIRCFTKKEREQGFYVKHTVDGLLRGDILSRTKALQIQRMYGAINGDEWREMEERNPLDNSLGEDFWQPSNAMVIGAGV
jgi:HK97 family phage portal protein